jgi:hypothetical protein
VHAPEQTAGCHNGHTPEHRIKAGDRCSYNSRGGGGGFRYCLEQRPHALQFGYAVPARLVGSTTWRPFRGLDADPSSGSQLGIHSAWVDQNQAKLKRLLDRGESARGYWSHWALAKHLPSGRHDLCRVDCLPLPHSEPLPRDWARTCSCN